LRFRHGVIIPAGRADAGRVQVGTLSRQFCLPLRCRTSIIPILLGSILEQFP
jgi:hypothetical protein